MVIRGFTDRIILLNSTSTSIRGSPCSSSPTSPPDWCSPWSTWLDRSLALNISNITTITMTKMKIFNFILNLIKLQWWKWRPSQVDHQSNKFWTRLTCKVVIIVIDPSLANDHQRHLSPIIHARVTYLMTSFQCVRSSRPHPKFNDCWPKKWKLLITLK